MNLRKKRPYFWNQVNQINYDKYYLLKVFKKFDKKLIL
jgi:hypothetical protein